MTYIAAFRCAGGIVMCADTLETRGDQKNYCEKLEIVEDQAYPLAVGGAGVEDILKPFMQEIIERVTASKPSTKVALQAEIRAAIKTVYERDVPLLVLKKQHLTPQFLIAAKPTDDDPCIFPVIGRRLYREQRRAIIGYPSAYNNGLLKRLHRDDLPMQQAVMLAIYLVSQSKQFDDGVGGDTQIVIVRDNGAWVDDPLYVLASEKRAGDFLHLFDDLFLKAADIAIAPSKFPEVLTKFSEKITELRNAYLVHSVVRTILLTQTPGYKGEPYRKMFDGCKVTIKDGKWEISEPSQEEMQKHLRYLQDANSNPRNITAIQEQVALLAGRQIIYQGEELVHIQGASGSIG